MSDVTTPRDPVDRPAGVRETAERLAEGMRRSVLAFPLTAFGPDGEFAPAEFDAYLDHQLAADPGALFVACGTGEFFNLGVEEYERIVTAAVRRAAGRLPVVAGTGYGTPLAVEFARAAQRAGADALLLLPPYLIRSPQEGLRAHVEAVAAATGLPLIVYQRDNVTFAPETLAELARVPTVIGLKDGHSDLDRVQRLVRAAPEGFLFFNGAPTAELQARAYAATGVPAYSSAVHAFAPEIAGAFFRALGEGDDATVDGLLDGFYIPWVRLRDKGTGYPVSLVKAAARIRAKEIGADVGPVRSPLAEPAPEHLEEARELIRTGLSLVAR
ncbi:5-dehydro-4-deoxyglucarate dehydratase [Marinactinospora thermotolerans]|uniref:Probable 5-dehydro-4-deoxyglucarate dehydratase n=1 Tax=Marinactinospora thermotolerans DSM 45154 TaxID=1122192 RepID=A0A1T4K0D4_9ACTN|nr:5-dehydro-4-deoxyglucarate dehydratase [Marinactinospora thermotolerans DSM 45154]